MPRRGKTLIKACGTVGYEPDELFAETITQGHGNAYPIYRLEWQTVGSIERWIRSCYYGVRAEMPPYGAEELLDMELFIAWRAQGLPIETPGVRR